ncbi:hypothetical protein BC832DRAFT_565396 [Gaertneriomyces semiglobifer]|nr:hypothetical protein BC832DRAFT_565396 [Gaertneriomyces semiglobifer]
MSSQHHLFTRLLSHIRRTPNKRFYHPQQPLSSPTLLYTSSLTLPRIAYFFAGSQMLLWLNLADWSYRDLQQQVPQVDPQTHPNADLTSKTTTESKQEYAPAPPLQRTLTTTLCITLSLLIPSLVHFWARSRIHTLTALPSRHLGIQTSNLLGPNRFLVPFRDVKANVGRNGQIKGGAAQKIEVCVNVKNGMRRLRVDQDGGEWRDRLLFGYLFGR